MAINFPDSPSNGDTTILGGKTYTYDSTSTSWAPATGAASVSATVIYTDMAALIAATGMSAGDQALVTALNKVFMYTGSAWYLVATMTNDSPTAITGVNGTYTLATDGTATTITAVSTDPEGFALTWSYAVTTGSLGSTATVSQADNVFTITPSSTPADAGSFSITFSVTDGATGAVNAVSSFILSFGFDLANASYDNLLFTINSGTARQFSQNLAFNSDGTKMFIVDSGSSTAGSDAVHQYSLTNGFSLAAGNVSYDNLSFSVASQETLPSGVEFNSDGTKMFIAGRGSNAVHQYSLTNGFSMAAGNVTYDNINFSFASQDTNSRGFTLSSDGTKMFITGSSSNTIYQYSLTSGFDLSSASYDSVSFSIASQATQPRNLTFNSDGTKMYIISHVAERIYQYSLTSGFDLSSVSYDSVSLDVRASANSGSDVYPRGIKFNSDGTKMFIVAELTDKVYQYDTSA